MNDEFWNVYFRVTKFDIGVLVIVGIGLLMMVLHQLYDANLFWESRTIEHFWLLVTILLVATAVFRLLTSQLRILQIASTRGSFFWVPLFEVALASPLVITGFLFGKVLL